MQRNPELRLAQSFLSGKKGCGGQRASWGAGKEQIKIEFRTTDDRKSNLWQSTWPVGPGQRQPGPWAASWRLLAVLGSPGGPGAWGTQGLRAVTLYHTNGMEDGG